MSLSKSRLIYILLALMSLASSFFIIAFGLQYIADKGLYALHLQAMVVISSAGLIDYLYLNRMERSAVRGYSRVKKILDKNISFIFIPIAIFVSFLGNVIAFFIGVALIRHFLNLRRGVEVVKGNLFLSYLSYLGQIIRNIIVFIPDISEYLYQILFFCSFIFEVIYIFIIKFFN